MYIILGLLLITTVFTRECLPYMENQAIQAFRMAAGAYAESPGRCAGSMNVQTYNSGD